MIGGRGRDVSGECQDEAQVLVRGGFSDGSGGWVARTSSSAT